ncbi:branched-chain amino acid ABC transporter permease [Chloroflexota bacterium]
MTLDLLPQYLVSGVLIGGVYALIALGVVLIYKATKVFNFAVGQMLLLGGFITWSLMGALPVPGWVAFLLALVISLAIGPIVYRLILRPLVGQPILSAVIATLGLALFLDGLIAFAWTPFNVSFPSAIFPSGALTVGNVVISNQLLAGFILAMVVFAVLAFIFQRTKIGLNMRAVAEDHQAAQATGVNIGVVFMLSWCIAGVVAAIGGVIIGSRLSLGVGTTPIVALKIFPVVLVGGLDSMLGAVVGGLIVGVLESLAGGLISSNVAEVTPYVILLFVLIVKPTGLFGSKWIERV